ncbi:MAG: hypothetical protein ACD_63C00070G0011 [uncultured bacterium]|nr:MAG: hypothetical protein ACD_63C00070G0011 [uncultured bacterium]
MKAPIVQKSGSITYTWYETDKFPKVWPITQAYPFCFNSVGKLLIVQSKRGGLHWTLPGGMIEKGESSIDALKREAWEEANVRLEDIQFMGYQEVAGKGEIFYQVRYFAVVKMMSKLTADPDGDIVVRRFINPKDFSKYLKWGKTGEAMIRCALDHKKSDFVITRSTKISFVLLLVITVVALTFVLWFFLKIIK